ncbi:MAG TPA: catalase family peroxidase [Gemmatimonadaceae bacterium]|jgi:catalase|nr:catalase family peroxidase [Gemmatimonadaceae bacterium]
MTPRIVVAALFVAAQSLAAQAPAGTPAQPSAKPLPQRLADDFIALFGSHPGYRINHAKGLIVTGTFTPAPGAAGLSKAQHLKGPVVPVMVRYSDPTGLPMIPDASPNASPHGIALRFMLPGGAYTDIVSISHNGFVVGTGEEFAEFLEAVAATKPTSPHPNPVETFLHGHPRALKFVTDPKPNPVSFADLSWYGNNALIFTNAQGVKQAGRYQFVPMGTPKFLDSATAAKEPPNYLFDELKVHLKKEPIKFRVLVQLPNPGDQTSDGSIVWPSDRKTVELGVVTLTTVAAKNDSLQKALAFNPIYLTDGIALSDDPLIQIRSAVYALSVARRR